MAKTDISEKANVSKEKAAKTAIAEQTIEALLEKNSAQILTALESGTKAPILSTLLQTGKTEQAMELLQTAQKKDKLDVVLAEFEGKISQQDITDIMANEKKDDVMKQLEMLTNRFQAAFADTVQTENVSFVDALYTEIDNAIGSNSSNQYFCMTIPGTILYRSDYEYAIDKNAVKPPIVEANESQLVNKMFDPSNIVGSDNGMSLYYQYRTALDALMPIINEDLAEQKNTLRQMLMEECSYDFGDGEQIYTMQEIYFRLYDDYLAALNAWSNKQEEQKKALRSRYPITKEYESAFLKWYEEKADTEIELINEKKNKLLAVFSPNDMKILEGVLDSGTGAELQEAREALRMVRKCSPNGGYIYPVKLNPPNWFQMLDSSFTPMDLMESAEVIAEKIQMLSIRRMKLLVCMESIAEKIAYPEIQAQYQKVFDTKTILTKSEKTLIQKYGENIRSILDGVLDMKPAALTKFPDRILTQLQKKTTVKKTNSQTFVNDVLSNHTKQADLQGNYLEEAQTLAKILEKNILESTRKTVIKDALPSSLQNLLLYQEYLLPIINEIQQIAVKMKDLRHMQVIAVELTALQADDDSIKAISTLEVPSGFTQIMMEADATTLEKESSLFSSAKTMTSGRRFLFFNRKSENKQSAVKDISSDNTCRNIQISMNVAKVGIEREWFQPGVFALSKNMLRLSKTPIAPTNFDEKDFSQDRFEAMQNTLFPCYSTAMVIARDITIRFQYENTVSAEQFEEFEHHASSGGGFLLFRGSNNQGSQNTTVHASRSDKNVTLKFDSTQLIGYYMEATRSDLSTEYHADSVTNTENGTNCSFTAKPLSIAQFTSRYQEILHAISLQKIQFKKTAFDPTP